MRKDDSTKKTDPKKDAKEEDENYSNLPKQIEKQNILPKEFIDSEVVEHTIIGEIRRQTKIEYISVDIVDWERLESQTDQLHRTSTIYQNAFWASVGLFANAVFGMVGIYSTGTISQNILIFGWCLFVGSFISLTIFGFVTYTEKRKYEISLALIKEEMRIIRRKNNIEKI